MTAVEAFFAEAAVASTEAAFAAAFAAFAAVVGEATATAVVYG